MNEILEHLINRINYEEMTLMFGDGSNVKVNDFKYSTNLKKFYVDITINATETDEKIYEYVYPIGLKMLVESALIYLAIKDVAISTNLRII
jgi:hypothetical protein